MVKCQGDGCGVEFPPRAGGLGILAKWANMYCPACQEKATAEWRKLEQEELASRKKAEEEERLRRRLEIRIEQIGGAEAFYDYTFDEYKPELNNTHRWLDFMKAFPIEAKNLFAYGPTGTGKTHLCSAKARGMWDKNPPGRLRVLTAEQFIVGVMFSPAGRAHNRFEQQYALQEFARINAFVLDELDKMRMTEDNINLIQKFIDERNKIRQFGLIIIANVDVKNIAKVMGLPIADRIDGKNFDVFEIPPNTPSVRGIIKRVRKFKA
jgi:DNA replication protein DnaC